MHRGTLVLLLLVSTLACTASRIEPQVPESGPYAPANQERIDGEVAYLDAGARAVRNARREDAFRKMHEFCGGRYVIVREELAESANVLALGGRQRRIYFRCLETGEGQPEPGDDASPTSGS